MKHAVMREMQEELGIRIGPYVPLSVGYHTASDGERQRIHYFLIISWRGRIKSNEAERVYWESNPANLSVAMERRIVRKLFSSNREDSR